MFSTPKPATSLSASKMITALMIRRKRPKVRIVTGRVRITRTGFTMKLSKLRTMATIIAVIYESTYIPFKSLDKITTARALSKIRTMSFIGSLIRLGIKKAPVRGAFKIRIYFLL